MPAFSSRAASAGATMRRVVPAQAQLGGKRRTAEDACNAFDHPQRAVGIAQEFTSAVALGDFVDGASHVDIDNHRAMVLGPAGGVAELFDIAAVKLHRQRLIRRAGGGQFHGSLVFAQNTFGAEQVGAAEAERPAGANDEPKRHVAITGDRRKEKVGGELDGADGERGGHDADCNHFCGTGFQPVSPIQDTGWKPVPPRSLIPFADLNRLPGSQRFRR